MKVKLDISPDSDIKVETDEAGNVLSVTFEPFFGKRNGQAILTYGAVINDNGVVLDRFALSVSASTGKISKSGRAEPVKAAADAITKPSADEPPPSPKQG